MCLLRRAFSSEFDERSVLLPWQQGIATPSPADSFVPVGHSLIHMKTLCVFQAFAHSVHEDLARLRARLTHRVRGSLWSPLTLPRPSLRSGLAIRRGPARATACRMVGLEEDVVLYRAEVQIELLGPQYVGRYQYQ